MRRSTDSTCSSRRWGRKRPDRRISMAGGGAAEWRPQWRLAVAVGGGSRVSRVGGGWPAIRALSVVAPDRFGGCPRHARVALNRAFGPVPVVQDERRTKADGGTVVKEERTRTMEQPSAAATGEGLSVMVTASDPLTSLLLTERLSDLELVAVPIGLDDMIETSRSGRFDAMIAVPPVSLLDYTESGWHDALVGVEPALAMAILATPRVPVRAVAGVRRSGGGIALLDSRTPTSLWTVLASIRFAMTGRHTIDPAFAEQSDDRALGGFSAAERLVFELLACGYSNRAIATQLFLSERTVETHVRQIFMRLGLAEDASINRRVLAARLAFDGTADVSSRRSR